MARRYYQPRLFALSTLLHPIFPPISSLPHTNMIYFQTRQSLRLLFF
jgi:hypothetical protein